MISNPTQRDDVDGTAASASSANYLARRQGNLKRSSDGFRSPQLANDPRRPFDGSRQPDGSLMPYKYPVRPNESGPAKNVPRNFAFLRAASIGAPRVGFPDRARCEGHYQQSGQAWGAFGDPQRPVLTPATNGKNAPPSHQLGRYTPGNPSAAGIRWKRPESPKIYDHLPH